MLYGVTLYELYLNYDEQDVLEMSSSRRRI